MTYRPLTSVPQAGCPRNDEFLELEHRPSEFAAVRDRTKCSAAMRHDSRSSAPVNGSFDGILGKGSRFRESRQQLEGGRCHCPVADQVVGVVGVHAEIDGLFVASGDIDVAAGIHRNKKRTALPASPNAPPQSKLSVSSSFTTKAIARCGGHVNLSVGITTRVGVDRALVA